MATRLLSSPNAVQLVTRHNYTSVVLRIAALVAEGDMDCSTACHRPLSLPKRAHALHQNAPTPDARSRSPTLLQPPTFLFNFCFPLVFSPPQLQNRMSASARVFPALSAALNRLRQQAPRSRRIAPLKQARICCFALDFAARGARPTAVARLQLHVSAGSVCRNIFLFLTVRLAGSFLFSTLK